MKPTDGATQESLITTYLTRDYVSFAALLTARFKVVLALEDILYPPWSCGNQSIAASRNCSFV